MVKVFIVMARRNRCVAVRTVDSQTYCKRCQLVSQWAYILEQTRRDQVMCMLGPLASWSYPGANSPPGQT